MRKARRWVTAKATTLARAATPVLSLRTIDLAERLLARAGPAVPVLSRVVAANMRSAGVYDEAAFRTYFAQAAGHLSSALRIFRLARTNGAVGDLARARVDVDESIAYIREAMARDRGVIVAPPHVCNYVLTLARLNQEVPVCVYLRWSEDRRKREMKHAWCEATGLRVILEPASAADPTSRAAACVEALRGGAVLVMTPDIAQRADKGVPVRLLGRQVYLPTGPASIALLAEAPLVPVFGRLTPDSGDTGGSARQVITARPPISVESIPRALGGRRAAIGRAMQVWADHFGAFLRACPPAWFLWADSRWTRVFRGDPRYARAADSPRGGAEAGQQSRLCRRLACLPTGQVRRCLWNGCHWRLVRQCLNGVCPPRPRAGELPVVPRPACATADRRRLRHAPHSDRVLRLKLTG